MGRLPDAGRSPLVVRQLEEMDDYDLYDILAERGYGAEPRTRTERAEAFAYKNAGWLKEMPTRAAETIKALAAQFKRGGTDELENMLIFQTPEVVRAGGIAGLREYGTPSEVLAQTKERMFAA